MPSFANLKRRLIVLIYEALLVFAVIFFADLLFSLSVQSFSFHQEALRYIRQLFLFIVIGVYFVYCWTKKGQTLAMKTWRIKIVNKDFHLISVKQAIARYIVSWMGEHHYPCPRYVNLGITFFIYPTPSIFT
jgi:uncharacterized RDD family membrane protein YckC